MDKEGTEDKIRIGEVSFYPAIAGGGISGCASAYFLKEIFGNSVELFVFEQTERIGGRLETLDVDNRSYELGGSILHSSNLYMKSFVKLFDLEKKADDSNSDHYIAFYDQNGILLSLDGKFFGIMDKFRMLQYFGFKQLFRFSRWIESFISNFGKIYKLQDSGFTFKTLKEFLTKLNPELYDVSQKSLKMVLEEKQFNYRIINHLSNVACLSNYGQSIDIGGLVGLVSIAGTVGDLWCVKDGNYQVPKKLLEKSEATVLNNTTIKSIRRSHESSSTKNVITYETEDKKQVTDENFDYVLIGFPIYNGIIGDNFELEFDNSKEFGKYEMQRTNTYFIKGNTKLFSGIPKNKRIDLHSVDPNIPYRTCCVQLPCDYNEKNDSTLFLDNGPKVYKVFSEKDLDSHCFDKMFDQGYEIIKEMPWLAYPKYQENPTSNQIPDIVLDGEDRERVYYLNAMEWSSSCMEISSISARNVSNLIAQKEKYKTKKFFNKKVLRETNYFFHSICGLASICSIFAFAFAVYYRS